MLILGLHSGYHDACACVFDGYALKASVAQERLTRRKSDGGRIPTEAIGECLAIAGIGARDIDLVALSHAAFPARYYTHLRGGRALERGARRLLGREKQKTMERELPRAGTVDAASIFAAPAFLADQAFRPDAQIHFYIHRLSHALPCLFHTDWDDFAPMFFHNHKNLYLVGFDPYFFYMHDP